MLAVMLAWAAMVVSPSVMAAPTVSVQHDVALQQGSTLWGQVIDWQGEVVQHSSVKLLKPGNQVITAKTDQEGKFQLAGLTGGVYQVVAEGHKSTARLWAPGTAPPVAQQHIRVITSKDVIRGQHCGSAVGEAGSVYGSCGCAPGTHRGGLVGWMIDHPIITTGAVAAAIAIPLAVSDDDDPPATP